MRHIDTSERDLLDKRSRLSSRTGFGFCFFIALQTFKRV
jgi:hypothetical protein